MSLLKKFVFILKKMRVLFGITPDFKAFCYKEFISLYHDKRLLLLTFLIPSIHVILDGTAINKDPKHIPTAICDNDDSLLSRQLISSFQESELFHILRVSHQSDQIKSILRAGDVSYVIEIPQNFARNFIANHSPAIIVHYGGIDPGASVTALASINTLLKKLKANPKAEETNSDAGATAYVYNHFNPRDETLPFSYPGLISILLLSSLIAFSISSFYQEKSKSILDKLCSCPIRVSSMIAGKLVPYVLWAQLQFYIFLGIGAFVFHVHFNSVILLCCVLILFSLCAIYIGIISSLLMSSMLAAISLGNGLFLIQLIFSGFLFPVYGMPTLCQHFSSIMPLTHFLIIIRDVGIKGSSFFNVMGNIIYVAGFAFLLYIITKKLEKRFSV